MKNPGMAIGMALVTLLAVAVPAFAQNEGRGQAVVTVLPKHDGELPPSVAEQDFAVKVNGKKARVTDWKPFKAPGDKIEFVILIDGSARSSLGRQITEIAAFVRSLPPNIKAGIAYMENGRAVFAAPLTPDHESVLANLHLSGGSFGTSASPYFCLTDLAKNWPSRDPSARREVLMITNGVDPYQVQYDSGDPYMQAATKDAARAGLVVYAIYWETQGRIDRGAGDNNAGQNLLAEVAQATGGKSFYQGSGNPVSFEGYFEELLRRFKNQYELGFMVPMNGKAEVEDLKLKLHAPGTEISTPQQVLVVPGAAK